MEAETESIGLAGMVICSSDSDGDGDGEPNTRLLRRRKGRVVRVKCEGLRRWKDQVSCRRDAAAAAAEEEEEHKEENTLIMYRGRWERSWAPYFGSFEDETSIGPMRFTAGAIPAKAIPEQTLQIFSIRVRAPTDGLKWPLHVHGYVATRDTTDHNRNYLFRCTRDNCQTLTQKDPFLLLTGPSRGIVYLDPITFETELKIKCKGESEDEMLAFSVFYYDDRFHCERRISISNTNKRCTLEYSVALRQRSVEATISIKIVDGSWPDNHRGQVVSLTSVSKLLISSQKSLARVTACVTLVPARCKLLLLGHFLLFWGKFCCVRVA